ncbi:SRPBCC domain-containing protein [Micrococcaceae bacterium Sec5.7]
MSDIETPHELVLVNHYDASAEEVWEAWTEPEKFAQWWAAPEWTVSDVVMAVEPRGLFRETQTSPDGAMVVPFRGFYQEVEKPSKLVFTLTDNETPDEEARTVLTVLLRDVDGGTEQEFHQTGVVTDEHFEALKAGTQMFFGRLGEFLSR